MDANYFHERRIKEARLRDHFARHISEVLTGIRQMNNAVPPLSCLDSMRYLICVSLAVCRC